MPELPEVQTVIDTLSPHVVGQTVRRVKLNRPDILTPADVNLTQLLRGRRVTSLTRRGKRIIFTLDDSNRFYIHLGMSGRLTLEPPRAPVRPHTHLTFDFDAGQVRFVDPRRFGGVWWIGCDGDCDDGMGPEPLTMTLSQLAQRLRKTNRAIKSALLDQTLIAGLGNIYVDESLFEAKIHPLTIARDLNPDQIKRLNRAIKSTLRRALQHRGSTLRDYRDADGNEGNFQKLFRVYDRAGQPCTRCRAPIERIVLGGRSTHFCPTCQPR